MDTHDLIVTYKNTASYNFPLILVIGREPNSGSIFTRTTGHYDFDNAPKCAFWNTSYAVVGSVSNQNTQQFKKLCRQLKSSPIAFTDASPVPIPNSDINKTDIRSSISRETIEQHVTNISDMDNVLDRTALVLLSGHRTGSLSKGEANVFSIATTLLEEMLSSKSIPYLSVPFMFGTNQPKIISDISHSAVATNAILETMSIFTEPHSTQGNSKAA